MKKYVIKIEGMACSMCEAHVNDAVRKAVPTAKKVSSSHKKGETSFLSDAEISPDILRDAIEKTGYGFQGVSSEEHVKRGLFG